MRVDRFRIAVLVAVAAGLGASGCHFGEPLKVLHASPTGELDSAPQWLELRFDRPLVDPDTTAAKPPQVRVTLEPPVAGEVGFPTPTSLSYTFLAPVLPAQRYRVTISSGLRSADGKAVLKRDYRFEFTTERNRATGLLRTELPEGDEGFPVGGERGVNNLDLGDHLLVTLRFPEKVERIKSLVHVDGEPLAGGRATEIQAKLSFPDDIAADRFIVSPTLAWPKHTRLLIRLGAGLQITTLPAGSLGSAAEQTLKAATYGPLTVERGPECELCRPPATLLLEFSTPVRCEDIVDRLAVRPGNPTLRCAGQPTPTMVRVEPTPALAAYTTYTVMVKAGIADVFGQKLGEAAKFTLKTGDANPRFAHQRVFNVLERKTNPTHEEKVYRAAKLKVEGARLPFAEAWKIIASEGLASQVSWTSLPWWLNDDSAYGFGDYDCEWDEEAGEEICATSGSGRRYPGALESAELTLPGATAQELAADAAGWAEVAVPLTPYLGDRGGLALVKSTPLDEEGRAQSGPVLRLLNVTDIGLTAKYSPAQLVVLAARLSDGEPIAGAKVQAYAVANTDAELGEPLATAQTDAQGVAVFGGAELTRAGEQPDLHSRGLFVAAATDDDEAFVWSQFQSGGRRGGSSSEQLVGMVYTERGVYRPGETVFFRAVLRRPIAGGLATPTGKLAVTARRGSHYYDDDEENEDIYTAELELSRFGTVSGQFQIPAAARIGTYSLAAKLGDQRIGGSFQVAEFRRAEMKVSVNTDKAAYLRGDKLQVRVNADYLFGAPAAGLELRWSLRRTWAYFNSKRFPAARFSDNDYHSWYDERSSYSEFVDEGTVTLDANGSFQFARKLDRAAASHRVEDLVVSATVEDKSGQAVSARRTVRVHPAAFHVGLVPRGYLKEKDKLFTFDAVAVSPTDEPMAGVPLTVSLYQEYWYSTKRQGPGGRMYWDYQRETIEEKDVCSGTTNSTGTLACQYTPKKGGSLRMRVQAKDKQGREVRASTWFWVTGDPDYYGGRGDRNQVGVVTESPEAKVGEKAKVVITSPFKEALALVTVEREDILWRQVIRVGSNAVVEIPIAASWVPNVYISATLVRGRITPEGELRADPERDKPAFAIGSFNLKVKPTANLLKVQVSTQAPNYEPGQKVQAAVQTTDAGGVPVAAEVNLYAVDEGVLMLTGYKTPDLIPALFRERSYSVVALDTRMHVVGRRQYITPVIKGEEDGGGGGDDDDGAEEARDDFNPVATWIGSLVTDANGKATHSFELPDTLTTYRLMAVAVTTGAQVGNGESEFRVAKTLMMRQAMPRFARPGDRMSAGVVVNQLSGSAGEVSVSLDSFDAKLFRLHGAKSRTATVGAKQTVAYRFDLEALDAEGTSEIVLSAKMGKFRDKVKLNLPVRRLIPRESVSVAGVLEPGKLSHSLALPDGARPVQLELNASGLPVASLEEKIRQLVGYPYGCLEQRTSKVMPLIAVRELARELEFASIPTEKIKGWVDEWVALVPKYRCSDDGFDYYPGCGSGSDPYLTAFTLDGLATARKFGYQVPNDTIEPAARYLENRLARMDPKGSSWDQNASGLAGALRVLAQLGRAKPNHESRLYEARAGLPLFAKTDLVRAIHTREGKRTEMVNALMNEVLAGGTTKTGALRFPAADQDRYWWAWDSDLRSTALVLRTLLEVEPTDARVPLIVRGLIDLDNGESYYTTQGVTQTVLALADAAAVLKKLDRPPVVTASINGKEALSGKKIGVKVEQTAIPGAELGAGPYALALHNTGKGPLYFGAFLHYAYPATARLAAKAEGFRIERSYTDRKGKPVGEKVTVGDFVMVNLKIWVDENGRMVVVDEPLPAGLEPVDTSLETSDTEMAKVMEAASGDWSWWRSRFSEIRDDRVEWHFRQLWQTHDKKWPLKLQVLTRAVTPGTYYAPGTAVERLYQPHIRGRGAGTSLTIESKP